MTDFQDIEDVAGEKKTSMILLAFAGISICTVISFIGSLYVLFSSIPAGLVPGVIYIMASSVCMMGVCILFFLILCKAADYIILTKEEREEISERTS